MAAAANMMMCGALLPARGPLVVISLVVTNDVGDGREAIDAVRRMRRSTRPDHQDEHQSTNEGLPAWHGRRP